MKPVRSGELAKLAGVHVETLRFYERKGLLPKPPRRISGYREYPPESVQLIRFIKRAQELGFSLREAQELLRLRQVPRASCRDVLTVAQAKLRQIDEKIHDLQAMRSALEQLMEECTGKCPLACCPIIENLNATGDAKGNAVPATVTSARQQVGTKAGRRA